MMLLMESMIVHEIRWETAREPTATAKHRSHMLVKQIVHMSLMVIREERLIY